MYRGRWFNRHESYICGDYADGAIYPVFQAPGKRRKKSKAATLLQDKLNQHNAELKFERLVHLNFCEKDLSIGLDYAVSPSEDEAKKALANFIRRLKRIYQKANIELKYVYTTERGRKGRLHHHMILSGGVDRDVIEQCWGLGHANTKRLQFDEADGLAGLTHYITKQHKDYRRWSSSKNLVKPEPVIEDGSVSMGEIADIVETLECKSGAEIFESMHPGWILTGAKVLQNPVNHGFYIRYQMRRDKTWQQNQTANSCTSRRMSRSTL